MSKKCQFSIFDLRDQNFRISVSGPTCGQEWILKSYVLRLKTMFGQKKAQNIFLAVPETFRIKCYLNNF